ncbi:MAG: hypothetical protein AABZ44_07480 [Elusimicrobiota bacterium]
MRHRYSCKACKSVFEFEATAKDLSKIGKIACPRCQSGRLNRLKPAKASVLTGSYVHAKNLGRLVKVSDRPTKKRSGTQDPCGDRGGSKCGGCPYKG